MLSHEAESERRKAWADSLPALELSEQEQDELDAALRKADEEPGRVMTVDEIMREALEA